LAGKAVAAHSLSCGIENDVIEPRFIDIEKFHELVEGRNYDCASISTPTQRPRIQLGLIGTQGASEAGARQYSEARPLKEKSTKPLREARCVRGLDWVIYLI